MTNPDHVSVVIAERLREAGWPQNLEIGDYYLASFLKHKDSWPTIVTTRSLRRWELTPPAKRGPALPSRRDLELALEEMGYTDQETVSWVNVTGRWFRFEAVTDDNAVNAEAHTPADAVALAYLEAKRREQDETTNKNL